MMRTHMAVFVLAFLTACTVPAGHARTSADMAVAAWSSAELSGLLVQAPHTDAWDACVLRQPMPCNARGQVVR